MVDGVGYYLRGSFGCLMVAEFRKGRLLFRVGARGCL